MTKLLRSWVESANTADTPFPLNNLPYGVFSTADSKPRCGVAIGDQILDVQALETEGMITFSGAFETPSWNAFMARGQAEWAKLRQHLTDILAEGSTEQETVAAFLTAQKDATLHMPITVAEYTDFYAGRHHATNVGTMFRGAENALPPNWLHIPIGYNGRASTVVVSRYRYSPPVGPVESA